MPPLPAAPTLRDAVLQVINQPQGRPATRFISATQYGNAPNLTQVCSNLINDASTLQYLEKEIAGIPAMLTIEDFVCRNGASWEFNQATVHNACGRVARFDQIAGHVRYT